MTQPPEAQVIAATVIVVFASAQIAAAVWRPALLQHPLLRPRWFGSGPQANRAAAGLGACVWLTVGAFLFANAFGVLPPGASGWALTLIVVFLVAAAVAQLASGKKNAA